MRDQEIKISVYGLGKMGLPLAAIFAKHGFSVIGVDVNKQVVGKINSGKNPIPEEPGLTQLVKEVVKNGTLVATINGIMASKNSNIKVIIVPVLTDAQNSPDLRFLKAAVLSIAKGLKKGDIVILESTVPPQTTELIYGMLHKKSGLLKEDFSIVHAPERISSGTALADIEGRLCPKIIGASDDKASKIVEKMYRKINQLGVITVSSPLTAELAKLWGEIYRDVNIAFANNLYLSSRGLGADAFEVIAASNTNPYSHILLPGPGVGGHCIPVYPHFMIKANKNSKLLKLSREINDSMSQHVIALVKEVLNEKIVQLSRANILILGIAYRSGVKEVRNSPGLKIVNELIDKARKVFVFDPLFTEGETRKLGLNYKRDFKKIDCVIITTGEEMFKKIKWIKIGKQMRTRCLVDTSNTIGFKDLKKLNFAFRRIGYAK